MSSPTPSFVPDVLIVDDHEPTAKSLAAVLRSAGYHTEMAHNGRDAITKAHALRPSCAMIDIHLPDLNGLVLLQKLRHELGPDVPLLVCSGDSSMETIRTLPHIGATYFLSKPVKSAALLEAIRRWLPVPRNQIPPSPSSDGNHESAP